MEWDQVLAQLAEENPGAAEYIQRAIDGDEAVGEQLARAYNEGVLDEATKAVVDEAIRRGALTLPDTVETPNLEQRPVPEDMGSAPIGSGRPATMLAKSLRGPDLDPYGYPSELQYGGVYNVQDMPSTRLSPIQGETARTFAEPGMAEWEYTRRDIPTDERPGEIPMRPGESITPLANTETRRFAQSEDIAGMMKARRDEAERAAKAEGVGYKPGPDEFAPFEKEYPPVEALPGFEGPGSVGKSPASMNDEELKAYYAMKIQAAIRAGKSKTPTP